MKKQRECNDAGYSAEYIKTRLINDEFLLFQTVNKNSNNNINIIKEYSSEDALEEFKKYGNPILRLIAPILFKFKKIIKKTPILGAYIVKKKRKFLIELQSSKDISEILYLDVNSFIRTCYKKFLDRDFDLDGFSFYQMKICSGMPKEAVIYSFVKSPEFSNRYRILNLNKYKKIYIKYRIKNIIKKIPLIGNLYAMILLPKRIDEFAMEYRITEANSREFWNKEIEEDKTLKQKFELEVNNNLDKLKLEIISGFKEKSEDIGYILEDISLYLNDIKNQIDNSEINESIASINAQLDKLNEKKKYTNSCRGIDFDIFNYKNKEKKLLWNSNIRLILKKTLEIVKSNENVLIVGYYGEAIYREDYRESIFLKSIHDEKFKCEQLESEKNLIRVNVFDELISKGTDTVVITNPYFTKQLLSRMNGFYTKGIKDKLVFFIPAKHSNESGLSISWGSGFSGVEVERNIYSRWFDSINKISKITIFNYENTLKRINLDFTIETMDLDSKIEIDYGEFSKIYSMENGEIYISEILELSPNNNEITFKYYGKYIQTIKNSGRRLGFRIVNFCVNDENNNTILEKDMCYCEENDNLDYSYYLSDVEIREKLHENGFFQVERHNLSELEKQELVVKSRFGESWSKFYYLNIDECRNEYVDSIYVARRMCKFEY